MSFFLAVIAAAALGAPEPAGEVIELRGPVELIGAGGARSTVTRAGWPIAVGDTLATGPDAAAKLLLRGNSVLTLGARSRLVVNASMLDEGAVSTVVTVLHGRLRALVGGIFGRRVQFDARTPNAVAGVRGTYLLIDVDEEAAGGPRSDVYSLNGPVAVSPLAGGPALTIDSGQTISATPAGLGAPAPADVARLQELARQTDLPALLPPAQAASLVMRELSAPIAPSLMRAPPGGALRLSPLQVESPPPAATRGVQIYLDFVD